METELISDGYKVVSVIGKHLWSAVNNNQYVTEYKIGEWVYQPDGAPRGLFYFENFERARHWVLWLRAVGSEREFQVWSCEVKGVMESIVTDRKFVSHDKTLVLPYSMFDTEHTAYALRLIGRCDGV